MAGDMGSRNQSDDGWMQESRASRTWISVGRRFCCACVPIRGKQPHKHHISDRETYDHTGTESREMLPLCLILKKVDSQTYKKMYYLHAESQEKYFEDVIRLHKSGCSNGAISRLLPVSKTTVSKWISIFVREKGLIMRVKRTEKLVEPDGESAMERLSKENSEILALIAADSQMFIA